MSFTYRAAAYLTLGLATSVVIAWTSAVIVPMANWTPTSSASHVYTEAGPDAPTIWEGMPMIWGYSRFDDRTYTAFLLQPSFSQAGNERAFIAAVADGPLARQFEHAPTLRRGSFDHYAVFRADGWPFRCLSCEWPWFQGAGWDGAPVTGGVSLMPMFANPVGAFDARSLRAIPFTPRWGGLLANTALWSFVWLVPIELARQLLRMLGRVPPGACVRCRQQLVATQSVCPECGAPRCDNDGTRRR